MDPKDSFCTNYFEILGSLSKHAPLTADVRYTGNSSNKNSHGFWGNGTKHVGML
jgi:hypothetical protein